jgi:glycosyltransferase involved in cell wall biosynthesis
MSKAIIDLLREESRRQTVASNGLALALDYSWEACGRRVEAAIQSVLNHRPFPLTLRPA